MLPIGLTLSCSRYKMRCSCRQTCRATGLSELRWLCAMPLQMSGVLLERCWCHICNAWSSCWMMPAVLLNAVCYVVHIHWVTIMWKPGCSPEMLSGCLPCLLLRGGLGHIGALCADHHCTAHNLQSWQPLVLQVSGPAHCPCFESGDPQRQGCHCGNRGS